MKIIYCFFLLCLLVLVSSQSALGTINWTAGNYPYPSSYKNTDYYGNDMWGVTSGQINLDNFTRSFLGSVFNATFEPPNLTVNNIHLWVQKVGTDVNTSILIMGVNSSFLPDFGTIYLNQSVIVTNTASAGWQVFTLSSPVVLNKNQLYTLGLMVQSGPWSTSNYVRWYSNFEISGDTLENKSWQTMKEGIAYKVAMNATNGNISFPNDGFFGFSFNPTNASFNGSWGSGVKAITRLTLFGNWSMGEVFYVPQTINITGFSTRFRSLDSTESAINITLINGTIDSSWRSKALYTCQIPYQSLSSYTHTCNTSMSLATGYYSLMMYGANESIGTFMSSSGFYITDQMNVTLANTTWDGSRSYFFNSTNLTTFTNYSYQDLLFRINLTNYSAPPSTSLAIVNPSTINYYNVSINPNITLNMTFTELGIPITSGLELRNITINNKLCTPINTMTYTGGYWTVDCNVPWNEKAYYDVNVIVNTSTSGFITGTATSAIYYQPFLRYNVLTPINQSVGTNYALIAVDSVYMNFSAVHLPILEWNGTNQSIANDNKTRSSVNKTSLGNGNYSVKVWANFTDLVQYTAPVGWVYVDTAYPTVVALNYTYGSYANNTWWNVSKLGTMVNLSCNATTTSPLGLNNITLWGDFNNVKAELLFNQTLLNTTTFSGTYLNYQVNYSINVTENDSYIFHCEVVGKNTNSNFTSNISLGVGVADVLVVWPVDTETWDLHDQTNTWRINVNLENYRINQTNNPASVNNSEAYRVMASSWRYQYNDSYGLPFRLSWYFLTHDQQCLAWNTYQNNVSVGCNVIANIMTGNSTYFSYGGAYFTNLTYWNDSVNWHGGMVYWNGTNTSDNRSGWINFYTMNGTSYFWDNTTNQTDYQRAEKTVSQFTYENALKWESFRPHSASWSDGLYYWLPNVTVLDFTCTPDGSGDNIWKPEFYHYTVGGYANIVCFKMAIGIPTNTDVNKAFALAKNGSKSVIGGYSHNYVYNEITLDTANIVNLSRTANATYGVKWRSLTAKQAAQKYFRITDTTEPNLNVSLQGDYVVIITNEPLYMAPVIALKVNNGTNTNFTLQYVETINSTYYRFNKSALAPVTVGYTVRGTDRYFNVNVSQGVFENSLQIQSPTTEIPIIANSTQNNITVAFKFYLAGVEQTGNVSLNQTLVGGLNCPIVGSMVYTGGQFNYNCTVDSSLYGSGLKDLFVQANQTTTFLNDTETSAVNFPATSLCTGTSNCVIPCGTNVASAENVGGYNLSFTGSGETNITASITNFYKVDSHNGGVCRINLKNGARLGD